MEKHKLTPLSELGEFGLIERLTHGFENHQPSTFKGIGDDAAVLHLGQQATVLSTDMLVEGIHFNLAYVPLKHLGYKAVAVNLSDIYAMNATPTQITVSLAVSNRFSLEALDELYQGIRMACERHKVDLVGGDTCAAPAGMTLSITVLGQAPADELCYRSGAKPADLICVSGDLGAAYLGLQLLERERLLFQKEGIQPELSGYDYLLERQLKPEPRRDLLEELRRLGIRPNAMIDVSDGLSSELLHLCKQSGLGCKVFEDKIPIDAMTEKVAKEFHLDPTLCALNGGEDYELLFTLPLADYDKAQANPYFTLIGHMIEDPDLKVLVARDGTHLPLRAQGWNAFEHKA